MPNNLVVVESPAKAKTIERYLGPGFEVLASYGHVRDLLPKSGAVDPDNGFSMHYQTIEKNAKHVDAIVKAMRKADALYLATDLDREGEAISWHLLELLQERKVLKDKPVHRVVFSEITKRAIQEAVDNPRQISMDLVNAQQARRALDYLVGFNLSPLLWKKIQRGLSAGRVQSPALRMIVEREQEIEEFKRQEYWTIESDLDLQSHAFMAKLVEYQGEKLKQFSITDGDSAAEVNARLTKLADGALTVTKVQKKQRKRNPAAPFITSTLQQEAVRKLGFTAQRAMRTAQQLYEGVDIGEGPVGLITYMRTDSVNLAQDALNDLRDYIAATYGKDQLPAKPHHYRTKAKNAQEAHEAIRPTSVKRQPADLKAKLSADQFKLYSLIWKRTVACQMTHATIDTVTVEFSCGERNTFRANGSTIADPGFMQVYLEGRDEQKDDDQEKRLPPMETGMRITLKQIRDEQHFTEPPPRYTEASLVKSLEEFGIGRPSTYASIISTLLQREYVEFESKRFTPTNVGRIVSRFLTDHFETYVNYEFTAQLEDKLDAISRGEKEWVPVTREFWEPFSEQIKDKEESVSRKEATQARELGMDPKSGQPVSVRYGRFGPYLQFGVAESDEKPRFVSLPPDVRLETVTLEQALSLARLPRELGVSPEGEEIATNIGRYGPYVRYGTKFVSLTEDDDPYSITLKRALELVAEKKKVDAEREIKVFDEQGIKILNGRYGPYITDGKKNARIPKDKEPKEIGLAEARELLAAAPASRRGKRRTKKKAKS